MSNAISPINPTDAEARALARRLINGARTAALAVLHPETGAPHVSLIALGLDTDGTPLALISALALHSKALAADPRACLLLGEPGPKGDPLTHPRLSLNVTAAATPRADHPRLRSLWLARHPKAKLYVDFTDFSFQRLEITSAALNGGFGRAYLLTRQDLIP